MPEAPIFVIGAMRSGTTLLRLVLDSHERIAIGPESGFMRAVSALKRIPGWDYGDRWYTRFGWSDAEIDERLRLLFGEVFERYAASQGKPRWGEKTPFHVFHMEAMASVFPEAVFVGIVRHPGAVAHSMAHRWQYELPAAAGYWVRANVEIVRVGSELGERFAMCRYEDLVLAAEPTLRCLLDFLGEPWSDAVLRHHDVQRARGTARVVDGGTHTRRAIDAAALSRWRDETTAADRKAVAGVAGPLCALFGYDADDPLPAAGAPWPVAIGPDVRTLRDSTPAIDFSPQRELDIATDVPEDLAERVARAEGRLERMRARRSVRVADAVARAKRARSLADVRDAIRHALSR